MDYSRRMSKRLANHDQKLRRRNALVTSPKASLGLCHCSRAILLPKLVHGIQILYEGLDRTHSDRAGDWTVQRRVLDLLLSALRCAG